MPIQKTSERGNFYETVKWEVKLAELFANFPQKAVSNLHRAKRKFDVHKSYNSKPAGSALENL
jgi:hypothetical protein